jgi:hypothetical protein
MPARPDLEVEGAVHLGEKGEREGKGRSEQGRGSGKREWEGTGWVESQYSDSLGREREFRLDRRVDVV